MSEWEHNTPLLGTHNQPTYGCGCEPVFGAWYPSYCPIHRRAVHIIGSATYRLKPEMRLLASASLELAEDGFTDVETSADGVYWKRVHSGFGCKYVRLARYGQGRLPDAIEDQDRERWTTKMRRWRKAVRILGELTWRRQP